MLGKEFRAWTALRLLSIIFETDTFSSTFTLPTRTAPAYSFVTASSVGDNKKTSHLSRRLSPFSKLTSVMPLTSGLIPLVSRVTEGLLIKFVA